MRRSPGQIWPAAPVWTGLRALALVAALVGSVSFATAAPAAETTGVAKKTDARPVILELPSLRNDEPRLQRLRREIADNLKATARGTRGGQLRWPLRFVRYRLRSDENFFVVMAKVSQDADTIASLNELANPNALGSGQTVLIPNARGLFKKAQQPAKLAKQYGVRPETLQKSGEFYFMAGQKLRPQELAYFRGEGFQPPLKTGRISSRFGMRSDPFSRRRTFHGGLDIAAPHGTPVYASRAGKVIRVGKKVRGYGQLIVIEHRYGYRTYYGHLSKILVKRGQQVAAGKQIGKVGATGRATGPHLHFEVRKNGRRTNPLVHAVRPFE